MHPWGWSWGHDHPREGVGAGLSQWVSLLGTDSSPRNRWGKELAWPLLTLLLPLLPCELFYHSPAVHISPCNALHRGTPTRSCGWHHACELSNCELNKPLTFHTVLSLTDFVIVPQNRQSRPSYKMELPNSLDLWTNLILYTSKAMKKKSDMLIIDQNYNSKTIFAQIFFIWWN